MEDEEGCDDVDAAVALLLLATERMGCEKINANDNARGESFSTAFLECRRKFDKILVIIWCIVRIKVVAALLVKVFFRYGTSLFPAWLCPEIDSRRRCLEAS